MVIGFPIRRNLGTEKKLFKKSCLINRVLPDSEQFFPVFPIIGQPALVYRILKGQKQAIFSRNKLKTNHLHL